jgi:surface antigen
MNFIRSSFLTSLCLTAMVLSGCQALNGPKIGNAASPGRFIAALNGGIVGLTGADLGDGDKQRALEAEYRALEAAPGGQAVTWTGRSYSGKVVAAAPYQVGSQNCRQYSHTLQTPNGEKVAKGVACRNQDGSWTPLI